MKRFFLVLLAALTPSVGLARDYEVDLDIESLEELYDLQAFGDLEADSVEILEALYQRPMNINRADRYLLYDLPGVTYELADAIVAYRAEHGPFMSLEELSNVEGMTSELLEKLAPFATVGTGDEVPVESSPAFRGDVTLGSFLARGFARDSEFIDPVSVRSSAPEAYLRVRGTGFSHFGAGALVTARRRTEAWWDFSRGVLVSDGPGSVPDLESVYLYGGYGGWSMILGSYTAGFGERLTFDSTSKAQPNGWYENNTIRQDFEGGDLSPRPRQFGVAASLQGATVGNGWLDATVFGSWVREDLYQYDLNLGVDEHIGSGECQTDGHCPFGFVCGDDNRCRSTRIYSASDPPDPSLWSESYRWETIKDAYDEKLVGANATLNLDDRSRIGVTGYFATTDFTLARPAAPRFAFSARMPRRFSEFGAVGVDTRWGVGPVEIGAEYARTTDSGNAAFLRVVVEPVSWVELTASGRYYDAHYLNPHSRPRAQRDELFGLAGRNEVGGRIDATIKPITRLRLVTKLDLWGNPWLPEFDDNGELSFAPKQSVPLDLFASQRVTWKFTAREKASLALVYLNKDLANNGRTEVYDRGDFCDEGLSPSNCGRGEARRLRLSLASERIPKLRVRVSYTASWEDVSRYTNRFDLQHRIRVRGRVDAWQGARWYGYVGLWLHNKDLEEVDPDVPYSDREEPRFSTYLGLHQDIGETFRVEARYGVIHFADERRERYSWLHLAKLIVEARF